MWSHHGTPWRPSSAEDTRKDARLWQPAGDYDPFAALLPLGDALPVWFPDAFRGDAPDLPEGPEFQHAFAGLVALADWIGSNAGVFPLTDEGANRMMLARRRATSALAILGLSVEGGRAAVATAAAGFGDLFRDDDGSPLAPTPLQAAMADPDLGPLVVVEDATGAGKTEAALWRFATLFRAGLVDGLYLALPTRAAAVQLHQRVDRFARALFPEGDRPEVVLAVPGYLRAGATAGRLVDRFEVLWDDEPDDDRRLARWAAESPRQYLAAQIAVGTVDQILLSGLLVKHAPARASALLRHLLVVDEVHASNIYMHAILGAVLDHHLAAGGHALLMSATLGSDRRVAYLDAAAPRPDVSAAEAVSYPALHHRVDGRAVTIPLRRPTREKTVFMTLAQDAADPDAVAARAVDAARRGAKVLVVRNTVKLAVATTLALDQLTAGSADADLLFRVAGPEQAEARLTVHHSRFARGDRNLLDAAVEAEIGKRRPRGGRVVAGTQTLEQSLDIDADLLITDLCPMDVLLQRLGRLHRHGRDDRPVTRAECIVLLPPGTGPDGLIEPANRRFGLGSVYADCRILALTWQLLAAHPGLGLPAMQRMLVERATHPDGLEAFAAAAGGDWPGHSQKVAGIGYAEAGRAALAIARRDLPLCDEPNAVPKDENVRTRIGADDVWIEFPDPAPMGPFGRPVSRLPCPLAMLGETVGDLEVAPVLQGTDPLRFVLGRAGFVYDALGLRED